MCRKAHAFYQPGGAAGEALAIKGDQANGCTDGKRGNVQRCDRAPQKEECARDQELENEGGLNRIQNQICEFRVARNDLGS